MKTSCPHCHSSFDQKNKLSTFCSMKCAVASRLKGKEKNNQRNCLHCGKPFETTSKTKKYCGQACKTKLFMLKYGTRKADK